MDDVRAIAAAATDETDFAAQLDANIDDPAGGFQTSIYRGAQTASDPDSVLGNQSAFADLLRGLSVMALSHTAQTVPFTDADSPALTTALERLERGRTELVNIQANVGMRSANLDNELTLLEREQTLLNQAFTDLAGKDQFEAATQLRELEANLEASYLLTTRLSNLSILNFL